MGPWGPWPQQPSQPPGSPPPPPPRTSNKRVLLIVGSIVVALALVVVGGIGVYVGFVKKMMDGIEPISIDGLNRDPAKDWKPGPEAVLTGKIAWSDTFVENDPFDAHPIGYWLTDSTFIRGSHTRLVAYQRKTGQKIWQLDAPGTRKFCGMATSTDGRTGALALDVETSKRSDVTKLPERICKDVQAVDLATGQVRWTTNFPAKPVNTPTSAHVELAGNVVIFQSDAEGFGVEVTNGKRIWKTQEVKRGEYDCTPQDLMPAPTEGHFVGLWRCGFGTATSMFTGIVSPSSGRIGQVADLPKGSIDPSWAGGIGIAATEPTVVVIPSVTGTDKEGKGRILVLDTAGKPTVSIPQAGSYGTLDLTATGSSTDVSVPDAGRDRFRLSVVGGKTLYAATVHLNVSQPSQENVVVAFDLATGKPKWSGKAGGGDSVKVVGADKDGAIAMSLGNYQHPPQVLRYAAADGKRAELGPPYPRDYISTPILAWMIWADDQVIMVPWKELPSVIGAPPPSSVWAFG